MKITIRQAINEDIEKMHRVRLAVRENRLVSFVIKPKDYQSQINEIGRGWVAEIGRKLVGFAIGNSHNCSVWALFVDPEFEGNGIGKSLQNEMLNWLWNQGCEKIRLTTAAKTRAEKFYQESGWIKVGETQSGEIIFEKTKA